MATSSITHNFFLTTREAAERFITALEESEAERANRIEPTSHPEWKLVTDEKELQEIWEKLEKKYAG